jgi:hypothetical protein
MDIIGMGETPIVFVKLLYYFANSNVVPIEGGLA